jgi:hypothetical protein
LYRAGEGKLRLEFIHDLDVGLRGLQLQPLPLLSFESIRGSVARRFAEPSPRLAPLDQEPSARGSLDAAPHVAEKSPALPAAIALHLSENIDMTHRRFRRQDGHTILDNKRK